MQNDDGGWGARSDHENNLQFLNNIPFADHNAMLDPSTSDVTARAMECLGQDGLVVDSSAPAARACVSASRAVRRRIMVRALGRQLCLWDKRRLARARKSGREDIGTLSKGRRLVEVDSEFWTAASAKLPLPTTVRR